MIENTFSLERVGEWQFPKFENSGKNWTFYASFSLFLQVEFFKDIFCFSIKGSLRFYSKFCHSFVFLLLIAWWHFWTCQTPNSISDERRPFQWVIIFKKDKIISIISLWKEVCTVYIIYFATLLFAIFLGQIWILMTILEFACKEDFKTQNNIIWWSISLDIQGQFNLKISHLKLKNCHWDLNSAKIWPKKSAKTVDYLFHGHNWKNSWKPVF